MKKCLIVVNTFKPESRSLAQAIGGYLSERGIESTAFLFSGESDENPFPGHDFALTLGGDGTVLFAARGCAPIGIPVFPLNLGEFGFIASVQKSEWRQRLDDFLAGKMELAPRSMVSADVRRGGATLFSVTALNDIVVSASEAARLVPLDLAFCGTPFGEFRADGIVVATATGSTAYSAAAGGPIVDPSVDMLLLSPVSPFSLSNRPLVLPPDGVLEAVVRPSRASGMVLTADGQVSTEVRAGDLIRFRISGDKALLAGCDSAHFYGALRSKLHWSGGPLA